VLVFECQTNKEMTMKTLKNMLVLSIIPILLLPLGMAAPAYADKPDVVLKFDFDVINQLDPNGCDFPIDARMRWVTFTCISIRPPANPRGNQDASRQPGPRTESRWM
jgi:hypothetical protein